MKKIIIFICFNLLFSFNSYGKKSNDFIIYLHHDANDSDYYSSIGTEVVHRTLNSYLGFSVTSSLGYAQITDKTNYQHSFISWEGGMKFGYFSDVSLYVEFGVDLLELAFNDRSDDNNWHHKNRYNTDFENNNFDPAYSDNDIDGYVGIGSSFMIERLKVTGFVRFREISGYNWQAANNTFSGIELAVVF
ncbi:MULTISPECIES: hypothetical protein [unclassified Colwellia]|uniref:hypothetical protein n=1 Tax=unclassified Colwellia TaxID=196834 RepID=UPI0015F65D57|nr:MULTISPECIES: hypothetical protein [unclassified Colwellia]MBA6232288.1 hypothetical protein [Colwellia sp. MB02u-7]MBA6237720.1 hypothetical protein [Colwellia sp. MB02u-11]MBA6257817.1 hypothetical protein [Colwellia sp. MB3u-28]MBA6260874.1 hypothetical protein [Colwellia sp. MB3u-41]MBA6300858.1 hypothetical protein [Colwellia sp. MB3u-22]